MSPTEEAIGPILTTTYGKTGMVDALARHLAHRVDSEDWDSRGREHMVMAECWNWFAGGDTAASVARKVEAVLS
jgi:hypothetical protein